MDASRIPSTEGQARLLARVLPPEATDDRTRALRVDTDGSFAAYFSAFPASYWAHYTALTSVELRLETHCAGTIEVFRSDATGSAQPISRHEVGEGEAHTEISIELAGFDDGGWLWFELHGDATLVDAGWWAPATSSPARDVRATIAITTLNREEFLVPVLASIAGGGDVLDFLERVVVIDHGSRRIVEAEGYSEVARALGSKLKVIEQANLGGSGGYSRGMLESLDNGSDAVILLDDDVVVEPESFRRLIRFAEYTTSPTIVGGQMFDMVNRTRLHAFAETIRESDFFWQSTQPAHADLGVHRLRSSPWLHARTDSDYCGWWMCLIPRDVLTRAGLSMPYFIKWDDAEFGVRARTEGFRSVSLPGAALWHVSWEDKDDTVGWQGYFHARNRIAAALTHSPLPRGGSLLSSDFALSVRYIVALEYGAQALRNAAYRDILTGPANFHETLGAKIGDARAILDATASIAAIPASEWERSIAGVPQSPLSAARGERLSPVQKAGNAARTLLRNLLPVSSAQTATPQAWLSGHSARWWNVGRYDSVIAQAPDGVGGRWLRRDRRVAVRLLREAWRLNRAVRREWPNLATRYRAAERELTAPDTWRSTTGG